MNCTLAAEIYHRELERKQHLSADASLPAGILVVLGGLLGAVATGFSYEASWLTTAFTYTLGAAVLLFAAALVFLICSYVGYKNAFMPKPPELKSYYDGLLAHYVNEQDKVKLAAAEFEDLLTRRYIEAAGKNTATNDRKSAMLHWANLLLAWMLVPALACAVMYVIDVRIVVRADNAQATPCAASVKAGTDNGK